MQKYREVRDGEVILNKDGEERGCDEQIGFHQKGGPIKCGRKPAFSSLTGEKLLCKKHPPPKI